MDTIKETESFLVHLGSMNSTVRERERGKHEFIFLGSMINKVKEKMEFPGFDHH